MQLVFQRVTDGVSEFPSYSGMIATAGRWPGRRERSGVWLVRRKAARYRSGIGVWAADGLGAGRRELRAGGGSKSVGHPGAVLASVGITATGLRAAMCASRSW